MVSKEQKGWIELCGVIREQLKVVASNIPQMSLEDLDRYMDACNTAIWINQTALCFDKYVEMELEKEKWDR